MITEAGAAARRGENCLCTARAPGEAGRFALSGDVLPAEDARPMRWPSYITPDRERWERRARTLPPALAPAPAPAAEAEAAAALLFASCCGACPACAALLLLLLLLLLLSCELLRLLLRLLWRVRRAIPCGEVSTRGEVERV
jgi:hypothetical protein